MSGPELELAAVQDADGKNIEEEVDSHIKEIWRLLQKKLDKIDEARKVILKELNEEKMKLEKGKEKIMAQIERAREALNAEKQTLQYFKQRLFESNRPNDAIVSLNVGGEKICSMQGTLTSCPGSTLSAMFSSQDFPGAKDKDGACFIDRNPRYFRMILEFLRANVVPEFDTPQDEVAFRKEVEFFGLTDWIFPPGHTPPAIQKSEDKGMITWKFRCDVSEIKKDSFYTSPDFLQGGNRWRVLFTERCSFLSLYVHNIDAGLMAADWEGLATVITITLKNSDDRKSVVKTIKHTFTRRSPDIGLNYFMLMEGLRSNKGGFLVTSLPQQAKDEPKPEIVFHLTINKVVDAYMGQPVDREEAKPLTPTPSGAKQASKQGLSIKSIVAKRTQSPSTAASKATTLHSPAAGGRGTATPGTQQTSSRRH